MHINLGDSCGKRHVSSDWGGERERGREREIAGGEKEKRNCSDAGGITNHSSDETELRQVQEKVASPNLHK